MAWRCVQPLLNNAMANPNDRDDEKIKKREDSDAFAVKHVGMCRKCGTQILFGTSVYEGRKVPSLTHVLPVCDMYEKLSMVDYLIWNNTGKIPS